VATDFQHTFDVLHALPCDIFLGAHGLYFDMLAKLARVNPADPEAVWDDPADYRAAIDRFEQAYLATLHKQQAGN
jgi:metallo-beta-lactamase class B